ncbi:hypothetical protein GTO91_08175 [Heliobacterium undosum]|uniref:Uncharacterized protein n=1 Tax=Heliomicrobium undosum TaxID=121734 RepID=A0A845L3I3_9FIRM|nr:hypothetical protein [Heliomicrobium undosum]MZP29679.1 hypothetical protein [Heliomicrobium undosum]
MMIGFAEVAASISQVSSKQKAKKTRSKPGPKKNVSEQNCVLGCYFLNQGGHIMVIEFAGVTLFIPLKSSRQKTKKPQSKTNSRKSKTINASECSYQKSVVKEKNIQLFLSFNN